MQNNMAVTLVLGQKMMQIDKYRLLNSLVHTRKKIQHELHCTKLADFF